MISKSPFFFSHHLPLQEISDNAFRTYHQTRLLVVTGASGTGKTYLCRRIHDSSVRKRQPFISQSSSSFDDHRFGSQVFGHVKGAFSGAVKSHPGLLGMTREGSLCVEDLDALSLDHQGRLLRFIQERIYRRVGGTQSIQFRGGIIFTSRHALKDLLDQGILREDFYFRIQSTEVALWPFSDRPLDFDTIAESLTKKIKSEVASVKRIPQPGDLDALRNTPFPGNIHGLRNLLLRSMISGVPPDQLSQPKPLVREASFPNLGSLKEDLAVCEKQLLERALRLFPYSRIELAKHLGISKRSLHYKLKQHGLVKQ